MSVPLLHRPIWCTYCEKVTDHRVLVRLGPDERLEPAEPPAGEKYAATCLSCRLLHGWWARKVAD